MTKEDISEPADGDAVLGCQRSPSALQRAVIHQVASAPLPGDCGEDPLEHSTEQAGGLQAF